LLAVGLISGLLASLPYTLAQQIWVEPLLRQAEVFEREHGAAAADEPLLTGWRGAALTNGIAGVGFALLLAAAMSLRRTSLGVRSGLIWGLAGFAVFSLIPALTLPVGLPGLDTGPLPIRQAWWVAVVICAAAGLMLLAWARKPAGRLAGAAIALLPPLASHLFWTWPATPPDPRVPQNRFTVATLGASALLWIAIGVLEGRLAAGCPVRRRA
jgi:cobalt transporter subunit CbtA